MLPAQIRSESSANNLHERLAAINSTDIEPARAALRGILKDLERSSLQPGDYLDVLENMRSALDFVQHTAALNYASTAPALHDDNNELLLEIAATWASMSEHYGVLLQYTVSNGQMTDKRALLAQRQLQYSSLRLIEYFRAHRQLPVGAWRSVHGQFADARALDVTGIRVADALNETWGAQSAEEAYISLLLIDAAGPYGRTPREFVWLVRWAQRFAPYCRFLATVPSDKKHLYAVDGLSDCGAQTASRAGAETVALWLDTHKLAAHIHAIVSQLKKGAVPASLGLGDDCVLPACARLLVSLYRPWGLATAGRKLARAPQRGQLGVYHAPMAAAFFLQGKEFTPPLDPNSSSFSSSQVLRIFGEFAEAVDSDEQIMERALQLGHQEESWQILDQSLAGYRLSRAQGQSRLAHRQLLGVRASSSSPVILGEVSWLQYKNAGAIEAGISLMPGPPQVVAVRLQDADYTGKGERYRLGFVIPAVEAMKIPASIILPAGWHESDRQIEVHHEDTPWRARLEKLMARGVNFDRASFVRVG